MDESPERHAPNAGSSPGGYLPRLRRNGPEAGPPGEPGSEQAKKKEQADAPQNKAKTRKKKDSNRSTDATPKGALLEETPTLDRIDVRRKVRLIAGSTAIVVSLIIGSVAYRVFTAKSVKEDRSDVEKIEHIDIHALRRQNETEAETLLERGHAAARRGNHDLAVKVLARVSRSYPETRAAEAARDALARPVQHLPLFPDSPPLVAKSTPGRVKGEAAAGDGPAPAATNPEAVLAASIPAPLPGSASTRPPSASRATVAPADPRPARTLPSGCQARSGVGVDASGWPLEIISSRDGAMMVLVPGGPFVMGHDGAEPSESPAHRVKVSTFYIDKHEVTNRQFEVFLKEMGPRADRSQALAREGGRVSLSEDFPVVMVSAQDARNYANWAGKRLPTEAQWEKAARGTDQRPYPWGDAAPEWVKPRAPLQVDSVMSFPNDLSPFGAYDLAGNVMEWTRDWYDATAYASVRGGIPEDPTGPSARPPSVQVAVRGCSRQWKITAREGLLEGSRLPYLGFRCVLPVEGPDSLSRPVPAPDTAPPGTGPGGAAKKGPVPF
jgi:formylglycine-generating enzyme required for sulfatase activity